MGEPVKIVDLAKEMIQLSGFSLEEIPIVFTGIRPGEKLFEEVLTAEEGTESTEHEKIYRARLSLTPLGRNGKDFFKKVNTLIWCATRGDRTGVVSLLKALVPTYTPDFEHIDLTPVERRRERI
jgi:FlaA1/EpsC-like NDP-sugar epimerase